jgi:succinate dehydrogenase / fumarate reductase flavoprotein subunit
MHGSNRLGGNSLSDLLVFGRRAGVGAADYVRGLGQARPAAQPGSVEAAADRAVAPFRPPAGGGIGENPYTLHRELQQLMNDLVGIIRKEEEIQQALDAIDALKPRVAAVSVEGHRQFNPGWHLALDLVNMLQVSECVARAALARQESRGGHTRDDYPKMSAQWRRRLLICAVDGDGIALNEQPITPIRPDLLGLFERSELQNYLTDEELPSGDEPSGPGAAEGSRL